MQKQRTCGGETVNCASAADALPSARDPCVAVCGWERPDAEDKRRSRKEEEAVPFLGGRLFLRASSSQRAGAAGPVLLAYWPQLLRAQLGSLRRGFLTPVHLLPPSVHDKCNRKI